MFGMKQKVCIAGTTLFLRSGWIILLGRNNLHQTGILHETQRVEDVTTAGIVDGWGDSYSLWGLTCTHIVHLLYSGYVNLLMNDILS